MPVGVFCAFLGSFRLVRYLPAFLGHARTCTEFCGMRPNTVGAPNRMWIPLTVSCILSTTAIPAISLLRICTIWTRICAFLRGMLPTPKWVTNLTTITTYKSRINSGFFYLIVTCMFLARYKRLECVESDKSAFQASLRIPATNSSMLSCV